MAALEQLDSGEISGVAAEGGVALEPAPEAAPTALAIGRDPAGELVLAELPAEAPLEDVLEELAPLGLAAPVRWSAE
ncbi:MAG: hypothetical protein R3F59_20035 [Myxococcota bacterium]